MEAMNTDLLQLLRKNAVLQEEVGQLRAALADASPHSLHREPAASYPMQPAANGPFAAAAAASQPPDADAVPWGFASHHQSQVAAGPGGDVSRPGSVPPSPGGAAAASAAHMQYRRSSSYSDASGSQQQRGRPAAVAGDGSFLEGLLATSAAGQQARLPVDFSHLFQSLWGVTFVLGGILGGSSNAATEPLHLPTL